MRTAVERGMLSTTPVRQQMNNGAADVAESQNPETADLVGALWRYRWAVILPAIAGAIAGFLIYLRTPETYRSTTRLMLESDSPAILDAMTGDVRGGGVPSIEIIQSQLYSDKVVKMAFDDPRMQPFRDRFGDDPGKYIAKAQKAMVLEPEVADTKTAQSLVMLLHFDGDNPELCEASVRSFSTALQNFLNEKQKDSRGDLIRLINDAMEKIHPKISESEKRYSDFRRDAPLTFTADGIAINPHRERQLFLVGRRSQLFEELRKKEIALNQIEAIAKQATDPTVSLAVIAQMLNVSISLNADGIAAAEDMTQTDETLGGLQIDKELVPLMIERNKYAAQFGENHPTVKELDVELNLMKSELKRIVKDQSDRRLQILKDNKQEVVDPRAKAAEAVASVIYASKAEVGLLKNQIKSVDAQIASERTEAIKIAKFEQDNLGMLREIERNRQLMDQLEEQLSRVSLTDEVGTTQVVELTAPTQAYLIGPMILKMLGIGTFLGLGLGAGLALLLEKNSSTFRNPDEIAEMLGVPVLTHVPFFKGRIRKPKKGEMNPFKDLDPYIAVVHQPASVPSEAIRSLRTSLFFEMAGPGGKVIQVTSPLPGDGKSTIAGNLACSIAQSGKRVLAIDCDLRRPQLTDNFAMAEKTGISNVLNGDCELKDACHATPISTLHVMPSGPIPSNPAEALTLPDMGELLESVREQFDFIVLDTPPLLVVTDPSITASMVDGVIMTLRIRRKSKPNAKESLNILRAVGANVLGVVINNSDEAGSSDGYRGYGYYRYGRYTSRYYRRSGANSGSDKSGKGYRGGNRGGMVIKGKGAAMRGNENGQPLLNDHAGIGSNAGESNGQES